MLNKYAVRTTVSLEHKATRDNPLLTMKGDMMNSEIRKKLYDAIECGDVKEVIRLAKDIHIDNLAAFIDHKNRYLLWSKIKKEAMFQELLRWKPQPTILSLDSEVNILLKPEIPREFKYEVQFPFFDRIY